MHLSHLLPFTYSQNPNNIKILFKLKDSEEIDVDFGETNARVSRNNEEVVLNVGI